MTNIGLLGEKLVARWLELNQYILLEQNWRCRRGEIDLIAQHQPSQTVAFVEVKTRANHNWDEGGLLAITNRKQQKLWYTASFYLTKNPELAELPCRFDVALVCYRPSLKSFIIKDMLDTLKDIRLQEEVAIESYKMTIHDYLEAAFD